MGKISFSTKRIHAEALADGAIYRLNQLKHLQGVLKKSVKKPLTIAYASAKIKRLSNITLFPKQTKVPISR